MANQKKRKKKKASALEVTLRILGYVLCIALLIIGAVLTFNAFKLKMLPGKYLAFIVLSMLILTVIIALMQRWVTSGIITKLLAIFLIVMMLIANSYINYTYKKINSSAGIDTKIDNVNVYVMANDPAQTMIDASDYTFGILETTDRQNTDKVVGEINNSLGKIISIKEYPTTTAMVAALYSGEVKAIIMNSAYVGVATGVEAYANFEKETRILKSNDIESNIVVAHQNDEYLKSTDRVFTIYVSGIDTRGNSPMVNSRSDVNILLTANLDTRQILLISTPRDFYVPLSISNGECDKITHAGNYGVDVSMDSLALLYGVNVNDYMKINFTGFVRVINALGGITVNSEYGFTADYDYPNVYSFKKGENHLNGEQALAFSRERHAFAAGDRQRGKNQMIVIEAVIKKLASSEILNNYNEILDSITDTYVTSMTYDEITKLIKFQLDNMKGWNVVKYSVTGTDAQRTTYSTGSDVVYVMIPDEQSVENARNYLKQIYNGEYVVIPEE